MTAYTGVLLGLAAAVSWGASDLIARFNSRAVGVPRTLFYTQSAALAVITGWMLCDSTALSHVTAGASAWAWAAVIAGSLAILSGTFCLYRAIDIGTVSIVTPISASYGAITLALSAAHGEMLSAAAILGMTITIFGVACASTPSSRAPSAGDKAALRGIGPAVWSAAAYGLGFWLVGSFAFPALGWAVPIWIYYAIGALTTGIVALARGESLSLPKPAWRWLLFIHGTCAVLGYIVYAIGVRTGQVAIVTVLSSLSSGVTVIMARWVLAEHLGRRQWAGVAAILLGVALLHA